MGNSTAPGPLQLVIPPLLLVLIMYVLVFRPQTKSRKDQEAMVKGLKKNDQVVTVGGIFGTVANVKPESITLRIDENVRVEVEPSAIVRLVKPKGSAAIGEKKA